MNRARKQAIIEKADEMPETASRIADGLHDLADAVRTMAGVAAWSAVQDHSDSHGRQKEMASVVLKFALEGFFSTRIDGVKVCEADQEQAERMFYKLFPTCRGK